MIPACPASMTLDSQRVRDAVEAAPMAVVVSASHEEGGGIRIRVRRLGSGQGWIRQIRCAIKTCR